MPRRLRVDRKEPRTCLLVSSNLCLCSFNKCTGLIDMQSSETEACIRQANMDTKSSEDEGDYTAKKAHTSKQVISSPPEARQYRIRRFKRSRKRDKNWARSRRYKHDGSATSLTTLVLEKRSQDFQHYLLTDTRRRQKTFCGFFLERSQNGFQNAFLLLVGAWREKNNG